MKDLLIRAASGALYIALLLGSLFWSELAYLIVVFSLGAYVTLEYCRLNKFAYWIGIPLLVFLGILLHTADPFIKDPQIVVWVNIAVNLVALLWLFSKERKLSQLEKRLLLIGNVILGLVAISILPMDGNAFNYQVVIAVLCMLWANDTFAYLVGKNFGKTKLMERVSPKKTIEGLVGGFAGAIGVGIAAHFIYGTYGIINWLILALIVTVFGTLGDLVQSKMKREAGVKDSGMIMPGHGGLYDRMDSLIFAAPFVYIFLILNCYVS